MRAAGRTTAMWWYCLVLCAGSSATDCPPVPATAMAGQRATANATALAAREVAATLRRDAPAPGAAADVLRAVLQSRDDFPARTTEPRLRRPRLPDEEQARGARGVRRVGREANQAGQRRLPFLGGHARRQAVVVPPGADGGHRQGRGPPAVRRARPEPLLRARPRRLGCGRGRRALRDAVEQGPLARQHQLAALRQGCGQPRAPRACALSVERPDLFDAYCPHVNGCAPRDPDQCDAAGERLVAKTYGGDVFPHSDDGVHAARVPSARKNGEGLRRASQIRVLEVSLASAGRVHGQLQPQSEWIVAARGRRAALGGGVRPNSTFPL